MLSRRQISYSVQYVGLALLLLLVLHLPMLIPREDSLVNLIPSPGDTTRQNYKYKATQFISFTINTLGGLASKGECEGRQVDPEYDGKQICYLGDKNITKDIHHRFAIVQEVLDVIRHDVVSDDPEIDSSSDILKIVMLPEFFLRGPNGAYSTSEIFDSHLMLELSDAFASEVSDEVFEDYLFVMGTIIFTRTPNDPRKAWEARLPADQVLYWNFCPIFRGGPKGQRYLAFKKYVSTADFLDRNDLSNPATDDIAKYALPDDRLQDLLDARGTKLVEGNVIEVDGLRIGIEICLDHRLGVLWSQLQNTGDPLVDIQLVTSAGMAIERGPNPIKSGGVVYLTDGEASSAACIRTGNDPFDPAKVCRSPGPGGIKHIPLGGSSEFVTLSGCIDFLGKTDLLQGYYSIYQTQGCAYTLKTYGIDVMDEFAFYPPSIEVYPVIDLPRNTA